MSDKKTETKNYTFFSHVKCEYFPCHKTDRPESFNCLFCFCPLYFRDCGGNCKYTSSGIKDCSDCRIPHGENGYDYIQSKLSEYFNEFSANK